jgi:hypothetical protein
MPNFLYSPCWVNSVTLHEIALAFSFYSLASYLRAMLMQIMPGALRQNHFACCSIFRYIKDTYSWGACMWGSTMQAEIKPMAPEPDNAGVGKRLFPSQFFHVQSMLKNRNYHVEIEIFYVHRFV